MVNHDEPGFFVGARRVSVTRVLKELKQTGKIIIDGGSFIIPAEQYAKTSS